MAARPALGDQPEGEVVIFQDFCAAGLIPPFSEFFMAVLEMYGLHMLHLHPTVVVTLSLFAYVCKAYVGVVPSVALSHHFFTPHMGRSTWIFGCVSFILQPKAESQLSGGGGP